MNALDSFTLPMIDHPAWGAKQGYGSFLTIEFGEPELKIHEWHSEKRGFQRQAYVQGQWHIWIYCCEWHLSVGDQQIAWSEDGRENIACYCQPQRTEIDQNFDVPVHWPIQI